MPVGPERSPQYELGYLYQVVAIYVSAFLFIAVDSVALSMIMFGCAQLDIIMDKTTKVYFYLNKINESTRLNKVSYHMQYLLSVRYLSILQALHIDYQFDHFLRNMY